MLCSLYIENVAVIERASIDFASGLNVLTGETGAGKSIIIDAINAVLGERVSHDLVRTGSREANVTALFADLSDTVCAALQERGYAPDEDGNLLIQRTISAEGKGSCRLNGRPITVTLLREIGRMLVNIHGQHENQVLLSPDSHLLYLDRFGELKPLLDAYQTAYHVFLHLRRQLQDIDTDTAAKERRMDMLRYQAEEIEAAGLEAGEEDSLRQKRELFRHAEKVSQGLGRSHALLSGTEEDDGVLSLLEQATDAVNGLGRLLPKLEPVHSRMQNALYELQDCAETVSSLAEDMVFDQAEQDAVEDRLERIRRLTGKYGETTAAVIAFGEQCRAELNQIASADGRSAELKKELAIAQVTMTEAAARLTEARRVAGAAFAEDVTGQLTFLDMPHVSLSVAVEPAPYSSTGADKVEFRMASNPGEPERSIAKIASGGELSRIMLAIKAVLADADDIDTLIFDEIDTGISGRAAWKVGIKLRETAAGNGKGRQILCVTHLAQIAAQAHHQLLIAKSVHDGRTFTQVDVLDTAGRERELARIIGGEVTDINIKAAREMLERVHSPA